MISRLTVILSLTVPASALGTPEQWDTFTNHFATDLAPLIVLFGEEATKQFLSESTTLRDSIIFGVAPLGVLTAVVSVIRACGSASLKAFIGRAQEPYGEAEAELCSSTSEDVCELWSNGGICRVFGRPWILEFFYMKGHCLFYPTFDDKLSTQPAPCGIYLARDVLRTECPSKSMAEGASRTTPTHWTETGAKSQSKSQSAKQFFGSEKSTSLQEVYDASEHGGENMEDGHYTMFARHPNLSLNFGIRSIKPFWHWVTALAGVTLQSSFFVYATWATFYDPALYDDEDQPQLWSFCLATSGTALLVTGMTLSAILIERRSKKRTFEDKVRLHKYLAIVSLTRRHLGVKSHHCDVLATAWRTTSRRSTLQLLLVL
jgi:hypothetical protein